MRAVLWKANFDGHLKEPVGLEPVRRAVTEAGSFFWPGATDSTGARRLRGLVDILASSPGLKSERSVGI